MPEDTTQTTTDTTATDQSQDTSSTDSSADDGFASLPEPVLATIRALRAEAAERRRENTELKKTLKGHEDANKSELERERDSRTVAEKERDDARGELLRLRVARKHDLPDDLAELLKGDDEAALEKHAKSLEKYAKQPTGDLGGRRGGAASDADERDMSTLIRRAAGRAG